MKDQYGEDWWNTQLTTSRLKEVHHKAEGRMKTETSNSWHQRRGAHPIDYVDIKDLETICRGKKASFHPNIIPDWDWFLNFMKELYPSRNVVCHMNPLHKDNVNDVKLKYRRWERLVRGSLNNIPR